MNTTTDLKLTNDIRFTTSKAIGNEIIHVSIRLNDECKNGHQDFSITGDIYKAGRPKIDKYYIAGGCIHEEIKKFFPEFNQFINLHLCDYEGIPMYAVENGFYHLLNGFNNTKVEDENFKNKFCEYYRLSHPQFDIISTSKNQLQYALHLQNLGILDQWKEQANKAIESLEEMTGTKFVIDSIKTQYHAPTNEEIKEEKEKLNSGYYTFESEQKREQQKQDETINKLKLELNKKIEKLNNEFIVKIEVLKIGGKKALDNCIYYDHSQTLAFNWKSYDIISEELINKITAEISLPDGVKIENKKGE